MKFPAVAIVIGATALAAGFWAARRIEAEMPHLVEIGNDTSLRMHSEGRGRPTVILEFSANEHLRHDIADFARVVDYDRGGWGDSVTSAPGRDAGQIARELHAALARAQLEPPYVLAGEGYGTLFVRAFAALYPSEVRGLLLCDPLVEEERPEAVVDWLKKEQPESFAIFSERLAVAGVQASDLVGWLGYQRASERRKMALLVAGAPPGEKAVWSTLLEQQLTVLESERETYSYITSLPGYEWKELVAFARNFEQMRGQAAPADLPVRILTSMRVPNLSDPAAVNCLRAERKWVRGEREQLLKNYPRGSQTVSEISLGHIPAEDPNLLLTELRKLCR